MRALFLFKSPRGVLTPSSFPRSPWVLGFPHFCFPLPVYIVWPRRLPLGCVTLGIYPLAFFPGQGCCVPRVVRPPSVCFVPNGPPIVSLPLLCGGLVRILGCFNCFGTPPVLCPWYVYPGLLVSPVVLRSFKSPACCPLL